MSRPTNALPGKLRKRWGVELAATDFVLRSILSEKNYQGTGHWLMFVFHVASPLERLPDQIDEGEFRFFELDELRGLEVPALDREILFERILADESSLHILRSDHDEGSLVEESRLDCER